jgi:hypothetical protein
MRIRPARAVLVTVFVCLLSVMPAHAQRARVFVASYGVDSASCGTFGGPCRTFQQAVNNVAVGGEVTALDSAGFQPVTITNAVTITSPPGIEAGIAVPPGGTGITIQTTDRFAVVALHGLVIDGAGSGQNGIVSNQTGSLEIIDVVVRNFTNDGIEIIPAGDGTNTLASFLFSKVVASHNGHAGIEYNPQVQCVSSNMVIDHTITTNNPYGMSFTSYNCANPNQFIRFSLIAISNSIASNSGNTGMLFTASGPSMIATIDNSNINNNSLGISAAGEATLLLKRSVITSNNHGIDNQITSPGRFNSYGDNSINSNVNGDGNTDTLVEVTTK